MDGVGATSGDQAQLSLSPAMDWQEKGARIRALLNRALVAAQLTLPEIERDTGIDEKQVSRALKEGGGAHPPLALVAFLLWHDERAIILSGLAAALGYELRAKTPDLAAENRHLRAELAEMKTRIDAVLGGMP